MTYYPTNEDIDAMKLSHALASPKAPFHFMAKARIDRGQPWNKGGAHRATPAELAYGIGGSTIGKRNSYRETARAIRSGECFTLKEAAAILATSPDNLRGAIARGSLKATKMGRDWFVTRSEVDRYAAENRRVAR